MRPLPCFLTVLTLVAGARAATPVISTPLATYDATPGSEFAPTFTFFGLSASALLTGDSAGTLEPGLAVPSSVFLMTTTASPDANAAIANRQYLQFTLTPQAGQSMVFDMLEFRAAKGGASGPRGWALTTSLDGFASILSSADILSTAPNLSDFQVQLPVTPPIDTATVFRLYAYAPAAGNGIFLDSITISGSAIPEPSTAVLLVLAATATLRRRR
jgi:hypothetical protein